MPQSVFLNKNVIPDDDVLKFALNDTLPFWNTIHSAVLKTGKVDIEGWHFSGAKYGWSYRIRDKKRVLIYLLPREGFFKVAFVFGDKALEGIRSSTVEPKIIEELLAAKKYAEGRGIRIDVKEVGTVKEILQLLEFKIG